MYQTGFKQTTSLRSFFYFKVINMKRKSLSKKNRFEVFKRDLFTCQYCGSTPPSIVLEVDHIIPVSKDGDNSIDNLVTSCFDCNRGKSNIDLDSIPESLQDKMKKRKEAEGQIVEYNKFLKKINKRIDKALVELGQYWFNLWENGEDKYVFGASRRPSIKKFLKHLNQYDLVNYMDIAYAKRVNASEYSGWKYFCGICWNKIKEGGER